MKKQCVVGIIIALALSAYGESAVTNLNSKPKVADISLPEGVVLPPPVEKQESTEEKPTAAPVGKNAVSGNEHLGSVPEHLVGSAESSGSMTNRVVIPSKEKAEKERTE